MPKSQPVAVSQKRKARPMQMAALLMIQAVAPPRKNQRENHQRKRQKNWRAARQRIPAGSRQTEAPMSTTKSQTERLLAQPRKMSLMSAMRHRMRVNAVGGLAADRWLITITLIGTSLHYSWQPVIDAVNGGGDGARTASIGQTQITPPFSLIKISARGHRNTNLM